MTFKNKTLSLSNKNSVMAKKIQFSGHYWVKPLNSDWTIGFYNDKSRNWYIIGNHYPFKTAFFEEVGVYITNWGRQL